MSWPRHQPGDGDSLQTDVMRFMAIIAFCLIAILALVRKHSATSQTLAAQAEALTTEMTTRLGAERLATVTQEAAHLPPEQLGPLCQAYAAGTASALLGNLRPQER